MNSLLDYFLDRSIVFSFDRSGFSRHQKKFVDNISSKNLAGKVALVTGGTAGIGEVVAETLSKSGSKVVITGRDENKGRLFVEKNRDAIFHPVDMGDWVKLENFCKASLNLDYIVLNAGSMPEQYSVNNFGVESQCASQLVGHYLMLYYLKKYGKINPSARIVWVSSGGMYLKKLELENLFENTDYDKVSTYANVKRAQVTLVEEMTKLSDWAEYSIFSMHPGWVATAGVREALPGFNKVMKNRLRSPLEGADSILWLLITEESLVSGAFYFDRKKTSPYLSSRFNPSPQVRSELVAKLKNFEK